MKNSTDKIASRRHATRGRRTCSDPERGAQHGGGSTGQCRVSGEGEDLMAWQGRTVLVTGAAGFIGSHLTQRLLELGASVTALVHYDARADLGNLEFVPPDLLGRARIVSGDI